MQNPQFLLFVLKQSSICYYTVCITAPLSVKRRETKNLAALVVSILKIVKDSIKKSKRLYFFKNWFCLHCSRE